MKVMDVIENKLMPLANVVSKNKYLMTLRDAFITSMPLLIVGSIFTLIASFPIDAWTDFIGSTYIGNMTIAELLAIPSNCTVSLLGLFTAFFIGYRFAEYDGLKDRASAGMLTLVAWFILMPFTTEFTPEGSTEVYSVASIPTNWVGSKGVFIAIIGGLFAVKIYASLVHRDVTIKMPAGVPPTVTSAFSALIPFLVSCVVVLVVRVVFLLTPWGDPFEFVFSVLQVPLQGLGGSLPAYAIVRIVSQLLWFVGIHGTSITGAVYDPVLYSLSAENQEALLAGLEPTNIITKEFGSLFVCIGGDGFTLSLIIAMLLFCRSKRCKSLARLSGIPGLFNINEPLNFGLPIVLNPIMLVPFVLAPLFSLVSTYIVMDLGIMPICNGVMVPWTCPPIISGFLVSAWRVPSGRRLSSRSACLSTCPSSRCSTSSSCLKSRRRVRRTRLTSSPSTRLT